MYISLPVTCFVKYFQNGNLHTLSPVSDPALLRSLQTTSDVENTAEQPAPTAFLIPAKNEILL